MGDAKIIVVSGVQGAGKSTVASLLAARFDRGAYVEADTLQRMIVAGGRWVTDDGGPGQPQGEAHRQLRLRLRNACLLATSFRNAGFTAVIDDIIIGERWNHLREDLAPEPFHLVVLAPDVATVVERDAARKSHTVGAEWAQFLDEEQRRTMMGTGLWVDSTAQTPHETVDEVLRRLDEGLIES